MWWSHQQTRTQYHEYSCLGFRTKPYKPNMSVCLFLCDLVSATKWFLCCKKYNIFLQKLSSKHGFSENRHNYSQILLTVVNNFFPSHIYWRIWVNFFIGDFWSMPLSNRATRCGESHVLHTRMYFVRFGQKSTEQLWVQWKSVQGMQYYSIVFHEI